MAPDEAERIFRPFHQANASVSATHGGSGLGLAISKELCERMGGSISLESVVGEGTTFTVTLPRREAPFRGLTLPGSGPYRVSTPSAAVTFSVCVLFSSPYVTVTR